MERLIITYSHFATFKHQYNIHPERDSFESTFYFHFLRISLLSLTSTPTLPLPLPALTPLSLQLLSSIAPNHSR